jgi:hypothetical protein
VIKIILGCALSALLIGCAAQANGYRYGGPGDYRYGSQSYDQYESQNGYRDGGQGYDRYEGQSGYRGRPSYSDSYASSSSYASAPRQECSQEPVRNVVQPSFLRSNAGLLLGGTAGALLGGQIGHGSGRKAATIGGGLLGAWGGYEYARRYHPAQPSEYVTYETRCR